MHSFFLWKTTRNGSPSEARQLVRDLEELRDFVDAELRGRTFYLEARPADDIHKILDYHIRSSAEDVTDEDFRWLIGSGKGEVRGIRA